MQTIGEFLVEQSWQLALMALLLVGSAFFSGAETALFSLSRGQLFHMGRDHRRMVRLVPHLMRRPGNVLTTILLGTNIVNIIYFVASSLLVMRARERLDNGGIWASVLAVGTFLAIVIGTEVLPKTLSHIWAGRVAPLAAPVLAVLCRAAGPIERFLMAALIDPLTRLLAPVRSRRADLSAGEMGALLALSQKRGLIGEDQSELLQEVLELTDLRAGDVMVPRVDMIACDADSPPEKIVELVRRQRVTKIPLFEGDLDHVIGVVHAKRLLVEPAKSLGEVVSPVQFVPVSARLERVLVQFRATRSQIAVVVDEYGGTAGLITLEDVLEEIVGDLADDRRARRGPAVQRIGPAEWMVDADLPIHEWAQAFPTDLLGARFKTVGGFVVSLLGHIPEVGERAVYYNVTFTVEAMRRRRIARLRVQLEGERP